MALSPALPSPSTWISTSSPSSDLQRLSRVMSVIKLLRRVPTSWSSLLTSGRGPETLTNKSLKPVYKLRVSIYKSRLSPYKLRETTYKCARQPKSRARPLKNRSRPHTSRATRRVRDVTAATALLGTRLLELVQPDERLGADLSPVHAVRRH